MKTTIREISKTTCANTMIRQIVGYDGGWDVAMISDLDDEYTLETTEPYSVSDEECLLCVRTYLSEGIAVAWRMCDTGNWECYRDLDEVTYYYVYIG